MKMLQITATGKEGECVVAGVSMTRAGEGMGPLDHPALTQFVSTRTTSSTNPRSNPSKAACEEEWPPPWIIDGAAAVDGKHTASSCASRASQATLPTFAHVRLRQQQHQ